jgi:hypothetical protein
MQVPSSRASLTHEEGTDKLSRNFGNELRTNAAQHTTGTKTSSQLGRKSKISRKKKYCLKDNKYKSDDEARF